MRAFSAFPLILLFASVARAQGSDTSSLDGSAILDRMSRHYGSAKSWHIEATEEETTSSDYSRQWNKTVMIGAASGAAYHYEGRSWTGTALHVSDGATQWDLHADEHAYTQAPASAGGYQPLKRVTPIEIAAQRAVNLREELAATLESYDEAEHMPDETITVDGVRLPCYVVHAKMATHVRETTFWIDKTDWTLRRRAEHEISHIYGGAAGISVVDFVITYSKVELDSPIPKQLFQFTSPADARQVTEFSGTAGLDRFDMTGQDAPDVQLVNADARRVLLSSYRGKPVLLVFWATWCAPCTAAMPLLAKLMDEAGPKGLVLLLVDEDGNSKLGPEFLAKNHYTWPNTQDDGKIGDAFMRVPLPLTVLIDAQRKIVFYKNGEDEMSLRRAIAGLGPEYASLAPTPQKQQPCEKITK